MASDSDGEWRYSIEDVGEDGEDDDRDDEKREDTEAIDRRIEPGSPSLENALFVALGALLALGVVARALGLL